jgi:WD40 repeat protein
LLASASYDEVWLWALGESEEDDGSVEPFAVLSGFSSSIFSLSFHSDPERNLLATATFDGTVQVLDLDKMEVGIPLEPYAILSGHTAWVDSVAFHQSAPHNLVASASRQELRLWDLGTQLDLGSVLEPSSILNGHSDDVSSVAFHPQRNLLASASLDQTVRLWDVDSPESEPTVLSGHMDMVSSVAFHPDPERNILVSADINGVVRLWLLLEGLAQVACASVERNLTEAEWDLYVGDLVERRRQCDLERDVPAWWP